MGNYEKFLPDWGEPYDHIRRIETGVSSFIVEELEEALGKMKTSRVPGIDNIPLEAFKRAEVQEAELLDMTNRLLMTQTFPES